LLGAEDYSKGKPDPEPYLTAMQLLAVQPAACIVVEDAEPGILAGRAAGAHVIAVRAPTTSDTTSRRRMSCSTRSTK